MTFSIVARDRKTGAFGVATATGGPCVGSLVPYARAGVGAIATQCVTNPNYGLEGLDLLQDGMPAGEVLALLTGADEDRDKRQCIVIGAQGAPAAWTGDEAFAASGSFLGEDVAVAGNLLNGTEVLEAMIARFGEAPDLPLEDRLFASLQAGEEAGSDSRGVKSAAMRIYTTAPFPAVDVRVDWSETPIADLGEVLAATRDKDYADFFSMVMAGAKPRS